MNIDEAFEVARAFLEADEFDNAKVDQDKKANCSVKVYNNYITPDGIDTLYKIKQKFPKLGFIIEGSEITVFTPEDAEAE